MTRAEIEAATNLLANLADGIINEGVGMLRNQGYSEARAIHHVIAAYEAARQVAIDHLNGTFGQDHIPIHVDGSIDRLMAAQAAESEGKP